MSTATILPDIDMRLSLKGLLDLCVMSSAYLCQGVLLDVDTYHGVALR